MSCFVANVLIGDGRQVATVGHVLSGTEAVRVKLASGEWRPARVAEGRAVPEVATVLNVHRATLYRTLERSEEVSRAEAKRRGAFIEDAVSESDALEAVQDERQEAEA